MEITRNELMKARSGARDLLVEALAWIELQAEPDVDWLPGLIVHRVHPDNANHWLLAVLTITNRACGAAEALLDRSDLPGQIRDHLVQLLMVLLAERRGAPLDEDRFHALATETLTRTVDPIELVAPIWFSLAILTLIDDSNIRRVILDG